MSQSIFQVYSLYRLCTKAFIEFIVERSIYSLTTAISFSIFFINILLKSVMTLLYQFHEACIQEKVFFLCWVTTLNGLKTNIWLEGTIRHTKAKVWLKWNLFRDRAYQLMKLCFHPILFMYYVTRSKNSDLY